MSAQLSLVPAPILTARLGTNAELVRDALELYVPDGATIADPTFGRGAFWRLVEPGRYRLLATDLADGGPDCRALPYGDGELDALVLDPPYTPAQSRRRVEPLATRYGLNVDGAHGAYAMPAFYAAALVEAGRVVRRGGHALVKCQDMTDGRRQHWLHLDVLRAGEAAGFYAVDLFVLVQRAGQALRHRRQVHARKNHSYLWILRRRSRAAA